MSPNISSSVPDAPTPHSLQMYCVRNRVPYMAAFAAGLAANMTTMESRKWAELTIEEMVKNGELPSSIPLPLMPDDRAADTILPPNPAHAPLKLKPRAPRAKDVVIDAELVDESRPLGPVAPSVPPAARTPRLPFVKPAPPVMPYADWWEGNMRDPRDWREAQYD